MAMCDVPLGGAPVGDGPEPEGPGPARRVPLAGVGSASSSSPDKAERSDAASLVVATLLGSPGETFDPVTGEVFPGPIDGKVFEYAEDGGEIVAVVVGRGRHVRDLGLREQRESQRDRRFLSEEEARRRAEERARLRAERSALESERRARTRVRRIVRTYGLRFMVTLTFPGDGIHDYDAALRLFQDFMHDHGDVLHRGRVWVAVPELHPKGHGWHWHVLVARRFPRAKLDGLRRSWTDCLGRRGILPSGGATFVRIDVKAWGSAAKAAAYASKYISKTFGQGHIGKGRHRFLCAQGAIVAARMFTAPSLDWVEGQVRRIESARVYVADACDGRPPMVWAGWE